jgi:hypothetical protein
MQELEATNAKLDEYLKSLVRSFTLWILSPSCRHTMDSVDEYLKSLVRSFTDFESCRYAMDSVSVTLHPSTVPCSGDILSLSHYTQAPFLVQALHYTQAPFLVQVPLCL